MKLSDRGDAQQAILETLSERGEDKSICPSEAARKLVGPKGDWRASMERVHEATDALLEAGLVRLSRKGKEVDQRRGAYRIARR